MLNLTQNRYSNNLGILALTILSILFLPYISYAQLTGPDLKVTTVTGSTSISGAPGSTVTVYITGDFTQPVNAVQFNLSFDSTVLSIANIGTCSPSTPCTATTQTTPAIDTNPSSVASGSANGSWIVMNNNPNTSTGTPGLVKIDMFNSNGSSSSICSTGQSATCSSQQIAVITFNVLSNATNSPTNLTLSNANFYTTQTSGSNCTQNPCSTGQVCNHTTGYCEAELNTSVSSLTAGSITLAGSGSLAGDVLNKGSVTFGDVVAVEQAYAQFSVGGAPAVTIPNFVMANALVNGGSTFAFGDVVMIKQYEAGVHGITLL